MTGIWTDLTIEQTLIRSIKSRGGLTEGRGMTESVHHFCVLSLSHSSAVHYAMMQLTGVQVESSEQHADMSNSQRQHDYKDCKRFVDWLTTRNPFNISDKDLHSISNGLVSIEGKDDVNCEKAEEVSFSIQKSLDNLSLASATIKRNDQIKTLELL